MHPTTERGPTLADPRPRPHPSLLRYYALGSLLLGPFFWALLIPMYFRFRTLRYEFDDEGVSMRWGVLFRREISLTYARIQDIHLVSNVVERWLGLARIKVQTASGNADAEMTIEGLVNFLEVRDYLYSRMRGSRARGSRSGELEASQSTHPELPQGAEDPLASTLLEIAREVRLVREEMARARRAEHS